MKPNLAGIYKIKNLYNGNSYIGQTCSLARRYNNHFSSLSRNKHSNRHLQAAYNKYGEENFIFEILLYCEPFELTRYEQFFVDTLNPEYNICKECVDSTKGLIVSEESKLKMRLSHTGKPLPESTKQKMRGRKHTDEAKKKISEAGKGRQPTLGKKWSEEQRKKFIASMTGRKASEETKQKIKNWVIRKEKKKQQGLLQQEQH